MSWTFFSVNLSKLGMRMEQRLGIKGHKARAEVGAKTGAKLGVRLGIRLILRLGWAKPRVQAKV